MGKVTALDVSELAQVDRSTVSRVLNEAFEKHSYAPDTVRRVREAATKLGYKPISSARALRTGKSMLLGMIVSDISNPFFGELVAKVEIAVREKGYHLLVCNSSENPKLQEEHITALGSHSVDGILISPSTDAGIEWALSQDLLLATIDRPLPDSGLSHVGLDHFKAGQMLGEYLKKHDIYQVGAVMPCAPTDPTLTQRLKGLKQGFGRRGKVIWTARAKIKDIRNDARQKVRQMLEQGNTPDAVIGINNFSTVGAYEALMDLGTKLPEQISIAGIDDFAAATIVRPRITVVSQPLDKIASAAANALLSQLGNEEDEHAQQAQEQLIAPQLIERESVNKKH